MNLSLCLFVKMPFARIDIEMSLQNRDHVILEVDVPSIPIRHSSPRRKAR